MRFSYRMVPDKIDTKHATASMSPACTSVCWIRSPIYAVPCVWTRDGAREITASIGR
jgi:hypothetical protein